MNAPTMSAPSKLQQSFALAGWIVLCFGAAATGAFVTKGEWYADLAKPSWNPPSSVFGPVWTTLYLMMAVAAWVVWRQGGWKSQAQALSAFLVQWLLNALWTPLFFGMQRPDLAFLDIVALWLAIVVTLALFWKASRTAGLLLVPYLAWVSFAAVLNFTIWRLNS
jgi:tryptophan-rich sensory protein